MVALLDQLGLLYVCVCGGGGALGVCNEVHTGQGALANCGDRRKTDDGSWPVIHEEKAWRDSELG